jgi:predicted metal-dependent hydrolase
MEASVEWELFIDRFNAGRYVDCVLPLEQLWFAGRDDFYKGLIRLCVALNQIRLGLLTSPRFLLQTAHELLGPYAPQHHGVDVRALRESIRKCLEIIPADLETGQGSVDPAALPLLHLTSHPGR